MKSKILLCLFCLVTSNCFAIEYYEPGDSLWVWAKNGLNIREMTNDSSKVLGRVKNGLQVVALEYQDRNLPYEIEEIKAIVETINNEKINHPNFELKGYWAKIKYKGTIGYVFDAYLSKLPTFIVNLYENQGEEDFHVLSLKKHKKILKQIGQNKYDQYDHKFVRYIFDEGYIIEITGGSGHWEKQMLFPDNLSLIEGYLIYSHTMKFEPHTLMERGEDYLIFDIGDGTLTIKKAGSFLIIYENHAC